MSKEIIKQKIPTLSELYNDKAIVKKQNELNIILNSAPKQEWIKTHPFIKNLQYLPIERIEYLLTMIFTKWRVEIKDVKILANSIITTVRLYVKDPITGDWDWQDGVGAVPIQVSKGSKPTDFMNMNSSAVQLGAPSSESYAIKDACEKFGKIFGKDLSRKDNIGYSSLYNMIGGDITEDDKKKILEMEKHEEEIQKIDNLEDLSKYYKKYEGLGKELSTLITNRKKELEI